MLLDWYPDSPQNNFQKAESSISIEKNYPKCLKYVDGLKSELQMRLLAAMHSHLQKIGHFLLFNISTKVTMKTIKCGLNQLITWYTSWIFEHNQLQLALLVVDYVQIFNWNPWINLYLMHHNLFLSTQI